MATPHLPQRSLLSAQTAAVIEAGVRAGRWRGWDKTECGIHTAVTPLDETGENDPAF